jgi:hypothetical protein
MIDGRGVKTGPSMSTSSPRLRRRTRRSSSRFRGRKRPPKRSRIPTIRCSLLVIAVCGGTLATAVNFVFHDDLFTRLTGHRTQAQIGYEDQITDLREQIDRVSQPDQKRGEQQVKPLPQGQATLEDFTSGLFKDPAIQARNSLPASGAIGTGPSLSAVETRSAAIVATPHVKPAKQVDQPTILEKEHRSQPASKGYIMYVNSPTNWTPVPLPSEISEAAHAPRNNNIRAEIEQAATLFDVDVRMMKAFARIESGYNPKAKTGSYKCLFQLSNWEFAKYWQGNIYDIRDCSIAAARKFATEAAEFEKDIGREATAAELYCIHQQGYQGCAFHHAAPQQLAWKNMYLTSEGQEKGEKWARKAIWGNVPSDIKNKIKGGVDALTSGQFIALWTERVNRFMARKVEPPTHYVQHAAKAKKSTKAATTDKKRTKVAASN